MRAQCACNAFARGPRSFVRWWMETHACPHDEPQPGPDNILQVGGAQIEHGAHYISDGMEARIGFVRE